MLEALGRGDHLPEGPEPEVYAVSADTGTLACIEGIIARWKKEGLCQPDEVLILHKESNLKASALGDIRVIGAHNLRDVLEETKGATRHTSDNKPRFWIPAQSSSSSGNPFRKRFPFFSFS